MVIQRGNTTNQYYQLFPCLNLQELVVDLEVTDLFMNHVAVNQYHIISLLPYALKQKWKELHKENILTRQ